MYRNYRQYYNNSILPTVLLYFMNVLLICGNQFLLKRKEVVFPFESG
uniref:Uncharacterized protein n=1 Tax=Anguilla anguilla TaxID=7936 RepID=A0A0E9RH16_ANGAN